MSISPAHHKSLDNGFKWNADGKSASNIVKYQGKNYKITVHTNDINILKSISRESLDCLINCSNVLGLGKEKKSDKQSIKKIRFEGSLDQPRIVKVYGNNEEKVRTFQDYQNKIEKLKSNDSNQLTDDDAAKLNKRTNKLTQFSEYIKVWNNIFSPKDTIEIEEQEDDLSLSKPNQIANDLNKSSKRGDKKTKSKKQNAPLKEKPPEASSSITVTLPKGKRHNNDKSQIPDEAEYTSKN